MDNKQLAMYGALALGAYFIWKHKVLLGIAILGGYVVYQNYKPIEAAAPPALQGLVELGNNLSGIGRY